MLARRKSSGRVHYYYATPGSDRKEVALGPDLGIALKKYRALVEHSDYHPPIPADTAVLLHRSIVRNARTKRVDVQLTIQDIDVMLAESRGRCAVSGLKFHSGTVPGTRARPFMPSVDRIVAGGSYSKENTRLVCVAVNLAMNQFGEATFYSIAVATTLRHRRIAERSGDIGAEPGE